MAATYVVIREFRRRERRRALISDRLFGRNRVEAFSLPDGEFVKLFRLPKEAVLELCQELADHLKPASQVRTAISVEAKVLCALRFYASGSFQQSVAQDMTLAVSQSSVSRAVVQVSLAISKILLKKYVSFPEQNEYPQVKAKFFSICGFPGVIGAVDCTQVGVVSPPGDIEAGYLNRKGFHSINVQLVCDQDLKIINVNAKYPGSTHDAHIWRNSVLRDVLSSESLDSGSWLLGDSGYPLEPWLMTPVPQLCSDAEQLYNHRHSRTRSVIERCNGLLKSRFRCLSRERTLMYSPRTASHIINACVVLHNICLKRNVFSEDIVVEESDDTVEAGGFQMESKYALALRGSIISQFR